MRVLTSSCWERSLCFFFHFLDKFSTVFILFFFFRCKIFDKHLEILAKKHLETKFMKLDVEKAPFLTQRLKIRVIPTLALVIDGKTKVSEENFSSSLINRQN